MRAWQIHDSTPTPSASSTGSRTIWVRIMNGSMQCGIKDIISGDQWAFFWSLVLLTTTMTPGVQELSLGTPLRPLTEGGGVLLLGQALWEQKQESDKAWGVRNGKSESCSVKEAEVDMWLGWSAGWRWRGHCIWDWASCKASTSWYLRLIAKPSEQAGKLELQFTVGLLILLAAHFPLKLMVSCLQDPLTRNQWSTDGTSYGLRPWEQGWLETKYVLEGH